MGFIPGTNRRMSGLVVVAGLTAAAAGKDDTDVKTWISTVLGMAKLTIRPSRWERSGQPLCRRTVIVGKKEGTIHRVGDCFAITKAFQFHRQTGIRELMVNIVNMTGEVAAPIGLIVAGACIHVDRSVPVVADGVDWFYRTVDNFQQQRNCRR